MTDERAPKRRSFGEWIATKLAGSGEPTGPVRDIEADELDLSADHTVVSFWAPWCGPCRMMRPLIDELALEHDEHDRVEFVRVNVDTNPELAAAHRIMSVPALVVVDADGHETARLGGLVPERELHAFIEGFI